MLYPLGIASEMALVAKASGEAGREGWWGVQMALWGGLAAYVPGGVGALYAYDGAAEEGDEGEGGGGEVRWGGN